MRPKIENALTRLRNINPSDPAAARAQRFLDDGCRCDYANEDFDVLQAIVTATTRYERAWR